MIGTFLHDEMLDVASKSAKKGHILSINPRSSMVSVVRDLCSLHGFSTTLSRTPSLDKVIGVDQQGSYNFRQVATALPIVTDQKSGMSFMAECCLLHQHLLFENLSTNTTGFKLIDAKVEIYGWPHLHMCNKLASQDCIIRLHFSSTVETLYTTHFLYCAC